MYIRIKDTPKEGFFEYGYTELLIPVQDDL
jgi:hypothetical protein